MRIEKIGQESIDFAQRTLGIFHSIVLGRKPYRDMLKSSVFELNTYYMGLVDEENKLNFYDGTIRVVDPFGKEFLRFPAREYLEHLVERTEPWSYQKPVYLRKVGWKGYVDGPESGIYRVGPLARLNVSEGMPTPLAQAEYDKMYNAFEKRPVHNTLAYPGLG